MQRGTLMPVLRQRSRFQPAMHHNSALILLTRVLTVDAYRCWCCALDASAHHSDARDLHAMSFRAPNSRAASPPSPASSRRGGARPGSGRKRDKKRSRAEITANATVASVDSLRNRQRLAESIALLANPSGRSLCSNELRIILRLCMWLQLHEV